MHYIVEWMKLQNKPHFCGSNGIHRRAKMTSNKKQIKKNRNRQAVPGTSGYLLTGIFLIVITGLLAYSNSFDCSFQFDDEQNIQEKTLLRELDPATIWNHDHNRFLPNLSFAVNYRLHEDKVWGYHFFNLLVHLLNALLVLGLVRIIFRTPQMRGHPLEAHQNGIALFAALLFVAHPLATQSVTYIVQRMASMTALFYLLSLWLYIRGRLSTGTKAYGLYILCALSALAAFTSKPNSYTLPLALVLAEGVFFRKAEFKALAGNYRFWLLVVLMFGFGAYAFDKYGDAIRPLRPDFVNEYREITPLSYLCTQLTVIPKYVQLLVFPISLNLDYDWPLYGSLFQWQVFCGLLFILALLGVGIWQWNKNSLIAFGILFFFLALAVESGLVPIDDLIFEHRTYLPSFGFFLVVSAAGYSMLYKRGKRILYGSMALVVLMLTASTYQRNKAWKDPETLWTDVISKSPQKARSYLKRGYIYRQRATELRKQGAVEAMNRAYDKALADYAEAIRFNPSFAMAYVNRGKIYFDLEQDSLAISELSLAIQYDSTLAEAWSNRGAAYGRSGRRREALQDLNRALTLDPNSTGALLNRSAVNQTLEKHGEAIRDLQSYLNIVPSNAAVYNMIGVCRQHLGQFRESLMEFDTAIRINPNGNYYLNRSYSWNALGDKSKALEDANVALQSGVKVDQAYMDMLRK